MSPKHLLCRLSAARFLVLWFRSGRVGLLDYRTDLPRWHFPFPELFCQRVLRSYLGLYMAPLELDGLLRPRFSRRLFSLEIDCWE